LLAALSLPLLLTGCRVWPTDSDPLWIRITMWVLGTVLGLSGLAILSQMKRHLGGTLVAMALLWCGLMAGLHWTLWGMHSWLWWFSDKSAVLGGNILPGAAQDRAMRSAALLTDTNRAAVYVNDVLREFAHHRRQQMEEAAAKEGFRIHPYYHRLFDTIENGDDKAVASAYAWIQPRIGQYERHPGDPSTDPKLRNVAWQYALETYGAWEQCVNWAPELLRIYANDILSSIPNGAVLFGGTDPGRFVLTAFNDIVGTNRLFVVTQNALADNLYMAYARRLYSDALLLPPEADSAKAFQIYIDDVRSGKRPRNAEIEVKDGRVTVSGALGVMEINGILAQMIFERNRQQRAFFVEESYVIPWMYPYLTPYGLILKLNPEPTEITDAMVTEGHEFWANYEKKLNACNAFAADMPARKTYSKLRSAIGGLYAARGRLDDAEKAFMQAQRLLPESPEANYRLVREVLLAQERYTEARRVMTQYRECLPRWIAICEKEGNPGDLAAEQKRVDSMVENIQALEEKQGDRQP
jgi:tetratricopeptide (TPR) repeat protein